MRQDLRSEEMESNPDQKRLITEVKDWCSQLREMVNDSGKKLVEEVKSSANPAGLKFVKNEDICALLNQAKVGVLSHVAVPPEVSHSTIQFKKKELTTITEVEESGESPSWTVGSVVIAKWSEDSVWYNAKIEKILADGACEVLFIDYGNADKVRPGEIVVAAKDIPAGDERDECVEPGPAQAPPEKKKVEVGQLVIARWSEDKVWYRAKVLEIRQGSLKVLFTDYGNEEKVDEKNIVLCGADIPAEEEDFVDENVEGFKVTAEAEQKEKVPEAKKEKTVKKEKDQGMKHDEAKKPSQENKRKESSGEILQAPRKETAPFQVGDSVIAKWSAVDEDGVVGDDVWYNGVSDLGYRVLFVDYGNFCLVGKQNMVKFPADIPKEDSVDDLVEIPVEEVKKEEETASAESDKTTTVGGELSVDTECLAKWTEDEVWYNAKVEKVLENGTFQVLFLDHGNSDVAPRSNIVLHYADIPEEEEVDEYVIEPSSNTPSKDVGTSKNPPADTSGDGKISPEPPRDIPESSQKLEVKKIALVAEQICLAKWDDDDVWYRAKVTKTSEATVEVVFTDYGNSAILARERIVLSYQDIPAEDVAQEMIDENVGAPPSEEILAQPITTPSPSPQEEVKTVVSEDPVEERSVQCQWSVHDKCVARWGEDQCWYRGVITALGQDKTSASVRFVDYDNEDKVILQDIVASSSEIPPGQEDFIDENVGEEPAVSAAKSMVLKKEEETRSEPSPSLPGPLNSTTDSGIGKSITEPDFFNFMEKKGDILSLSIKKKHVFKVSGPAGVTVLADGSVAIVSRMSDSVKIFSRTGAPLPCLLEGPRKFDKPTNILRLANGKIVVRDAKGIQLFTQEGKFVRTLGVTSQNCYYGLAEDSQGNVLTINYRDAAKPSGVGTTTAAGATDVFGLHEEGELCRQIELEDLVEEEEKVRSKCRHLGFSKGQVFISDIGLHRVFIINELEASVFGEAGDKPGQFSNPAEAAFDGVGNSIIVDSKNNRLQLVDANQNPYPVKVDHPLVKPAGIHFDKDNNEVYVSNFGENTVVCFKLS